VIQTGPTQHWRAYALQPNSLLIQITIDRLPAIQPNLQSALQSICKVNYDCDNSCKRSIIGRINFVTCEIANSSAQIACQAGEPYAMTYNCDEQFLEYGNLIPGLNSGFPIFSWACSPCADWW
jgi:hypothetical protein